MEGGRPLIAFLLATSMLDKHVKPLNGTPGLGLHLLVFCSLIACDLFRSWRCTCCLAPVHCPTPTSVGLQMARCSSPLPSARAYPERNVVHRRKDKRKPPPDSLLLGCIYCGTDRL